MQRFCTGIGGGTDMIVANKYWPITKQICIIITLGSTIRSAAHSDSPANGKIARTVKNIATSLRGKLYLEYEHL